MSSYLVAALFCLAGLFSPHLAADEQPYAWAPALALGSHLPAFELVDDAGLRHSSAALPGARGMLLFFNRSTDW